MSAYHGNNYLPLVERFYRSHRPVLLTLVDAIVLEATSADRSVLAAVEFIRANRDRRSDWIPPATTVQRAGEQVAVTIDVDAFAGDQWRAVLRDRKHPGMLARRHLEVCVFSALAAELRSGDIAVAGSDSYANLHAQLMSWADCAPLVSGFCAQAGIPSQAPALVAHYRQELARTAARVDAGYPANTDLVLEGDKPVLKRRKGADRRPEAIALEAAIHQRLPERSLLDVLTRAAYLTGWYRHFGPASGSDPKIRDSLGRYVITTYAYGTNFGPAEVARHLRGSVSAHEIYTAGNKHADASKVYRASTDVINEFARLDVAGIWGDGQVVAVDGSQVDTWENNLLAESHIRYGGYGGIAMRHVADSYIALFSHFISCGVWEAVYIIDGLLRNESDIQPDTVHADTQGQSLPVFGLAALLGFELLPRIRNWKARRASDVILIKTLLYTGVRVAELVRIRLADVDLDTCRIRITQGKGGKDRVVPFPAAFKETLALHIDAQRRAGAAYLFESSWKKPYSDRGVRKILTRYTQAAGITASISPHTLRHFLFTWLKTQGIDDALIQPYSGHATRQSLEIYSRLALADAQQRYDDVIGDFPV